MDTAKTKPRLVFSEYYNDFIPDTGDETKKKTTEKIYNLIINKKDPDYLSDIEKVIFQDAKKFYSDYPFYVMIDNIPKIFVGLILFLLYVLSNDNLDLAIILIGYTILVSLIILKDLASRKEKLYEFIEYEVETVK